MLWFGRRFGGRCNQYSGGQFALFLEDVLEGSAINTVEGGLLYFWKNPGICHGMIPSSPPIKGGPLPSQAQQHTKGSRASLLE
jgi:hypothetical protein